MADHDREKILAALVIALIVSIAITTEILNDLVDPYLNATDRVVNIFNFYSMHEGPSDNEVYFIGSSQAAGDIDSCILENILKRRNISYQVYNIGYSGDTPLRRVTELPQLVQSKPKIVFICLTYYGLNNPSFNISDDSLALVSDRIILDSYTKSLLTKEELALVNMNPFYLKFYKRGFILPSLHACLLRRNLSADAEVAGNFKIPQTFNENLTEDLMRIKLNNSRDVLDKYIVYKGDNNQKRALNYTIARLRSAGIDVAIINMPLNPILAAKVTNETRANYFNFLDSMGITYYDFESKFPVECYSDLTHLNSAGREAFSKDLAEIVAERVRR
ncbi:MAG: SGNH/GDSL hydrolase family protein [Methanotrichaceae archaeon]